MSNLLQRVATVLTESAGARSRIVFAEALIKGHPGLDQRRKSKAELPIFFIVQPHKRLKFDFLIVQSLMWLNNGGTSLYRGNL